FPLSAQRVGVFACWRVGVLAGEREAQVSGRQGGLGAAPPQGTGQEDSKSRRAPLAHYKGTSAILKATRGLFSGGGSFVVAPASRDSRRCGRARGLQLEQALDDVLDAPRVDRPLDGGRPGAPRERAAVASRALPRHDGLLEGHAGGRDLERDVPQR